MPFASADQRKFFGARLDRAGISAARKHAVMCRFDQDRLTKADKALLKRAL